ncbi:FUSC family protein [Arenibaculum pallidiluteum]|uniref:FUSC family protein n=1 Tax=Arenibaculum pallidiluteum TaxID=2812559 RepID=UPI001A96B545|nr:FUSC family protein [Arenibaculum pallidiluteum]
MNDISRRRTARHLVTLRQLCEVIALTPQPSLRIALIAGGQAALSALAATLLICATPWQHLIAFPALGALASLFGRYAPVQRRMTIVTICAALLTGGVLLQSLASSAGASPVERLLLLALIAGGATLAIAHWRLGGPGPIIVTFASAGALGPVASWHAAAEQTLAAAAGGAVAWVVCRITDRLRSAELEVLVLPQAPHRPFRHEVIAAGRIAAGTAAAALIAQAAGWPHPSWAAIGALAVLQGAHLHVTMSRALQRMAGTLVGVFLAWAVLAQDLPLWGLIAAVVLFQFVTEVVIGYNYALGQITVTPMALIMTYIAAPATAVGMPVERALESILGVALGIVFAVLFSTADDRVYLARHREGQPAP